jgi:serine/threonine protein kinase
MEKTKSINIPIIIDDTRQFKLQIDEKWKFSNNIYGDHIYNVINSDDSCQYVAKILKIDSREDEPGWYTSFDRVRNELTISKLMSDEGLGPKIYDMSLNEKEGIIIMDKFDSNLVQLMLKYKTDRTIKMLDIINNVTIIVNKMHLLGIYHGDLHLRNILYKKTGGVIISDFGYSLLTTSQELKDSELTHLDGFKEIYKLINDESLKIYDEDSFDNVMFDVTCVSQHDFNFTWNGKKCEWFC